MRKPGITIFALLAGIPVIIVSLLAFGVITGDQIMESLTQDTFVLQEIDCDSLNLQVIAEATDGGWGKDKVLIRVHNKTTNTTKDSSGFASFARSGPYPRFDIKIHPNCGLFAILKDKTLLALYERETDFMWPNITVSDDEKRIADSRKLEMIKKYNLLVD